MRIATWNINGVRARLDGAVQWLRDVSPDILCFQEIKSEDTNFPREAFGDLGYNIALNGQKGFNGVAILAKGVEPVLRLRGLPDDPDPSHSRYIEADIGEWVIGCIYLPNGNPQPGPKFDYKLAWFEKLAVHARTLLADERPTILCGDYNVIPNDSRDEVYSARDMASDALTQPESRAALRSLLFQGWTDAIRSRHPTGPVYTFWDYQAGAWARDAGFRIDHLLLSPAAADRLLDAGVDKEARGREKASDHAPVWVVVRD